MALLYKGICMVLAALEVGKAELLADEMTQNKRWL